MGKEQNSGGEARLVKILLDYGGALSLVVLTVLIQMRAGPLFEQRAYCSPLLIATCYATWRGGKGPGLATLVAGGLAATYYLAPPRDSFLVESRADVIAIVLYLLVGLTIVLFGEAHRMERRKVLEREAELKIAYAKLEEANASLDNLVARRTAELTEIKNYVAEEM